MPSCRPWVAICWRRWRLTAKTRLPTSWAMVDELSVNLASYADAMETYADFATVNRVIDAYNLAQTVDAGKADQHPGAAQATLFRQGGSADEAWAGAEGALHRHRRHRRRELPPPCGGLALAGGRGVLQPGERPHVLRGQRPAPSASISSCAASSTSKPIG